MSPSPSERPLRDALADLAASERSEEELRELLAELGVLRPEPPADVQGIDRPRKESAAAKRKRELEKKANGMKKGDARADKRKPMPAKAAHEKYEKYGLKWSGNGKGLICGCNGASQEGKSEWLIRRHLFESKKHLKWRDEREKEAQDQANDGTKPIAVLGREEENVDVEEAFRSAFAEACGIEGGAVYDQQNVPGLTDADPSAPLVATLYLCSGRTVTLGEAGGDDGQEDADEGGEGGGVVVVIGVEGGVGGGSVGVEHREQRRFLAQSCFKPLVYAMALERGLGDDVRRSVGCFGDAPFGTFDRAPDGKRALNPLINSGALVVLELLSRDHSIEEVGRWCRDLGVGLESGDGNGGAAAPLFDPAAVEATEADSMRNRGLSCALAASGAMGPTADTDAVERAVAYYAAMDCLRVTCSELAAVAASFAGSPPSATATLAADETATTADINGTLSAATRRATLATMMHCGMYEESGAWARDVGVPAKSGVSGAVWAVIPGVGGLCAHQPRIDSVGNSVQAMALLRGLAKRCPTISIFA